MPGNNLTALIVALILLVCTHSSWAEASYCANYTETCTYMNHSNCTVTFPSISPRRHGSLMSQSRAARRCVVEVSCASDCFSICFATKSVLRSTNPETLYNIKLKYFYSNNILLQEEPEWQNLNSTEATSRLKLDMENKLVDGNSFVPDRKFKIRVTYDCSNELRCAIYE